MEPFDPILIAEEMDKGYPMDSLRRLPRPVETEDAPSVQTVDDPSLDRVRMELRLLSELDPYSQPKSYTFPTWANHLAMAQ